MTRIKRNVTVTIIVADATRRFCGQSCPFLKNKKYCTLYGEHLVRMIFIDEVKTQRCFVCEYEDKNNEMESCI